jgi:MFS family permease
VLHNRTPSTFVIPPKKTPMPLTPKENLSDEDVRKGLKMVIWDGLAAEVMIVFTGSTFLVAIALLLGASNIQIGLLAAMPTITNLSQLISITLVRRFNNRRAIAVYCTWLARIPLLIIGILILISNHTSVHSLIFFFFFYYFFGSIAGPSWNSWMKDMVPENMLGTYFSRRTRLSQALNVILSLVLALVLDDIRKYHPENELAVYAVFFILAGLFGLIGGFMLSKAPEPKGKLSNADILSLFKLPLQNGNFRRLLVFNSAWVFAINIGQPFFTVFLMKGMGLPVSYIIILGVISQVVSILTLRVWGVYSDRYSNKTIIGLSTPIYIACIIAWCFVGIFRHSFMNLGLLVGIYVFSGIATAGTNLSLTNIGLKLAPREDAIVYISVKNIVTAVFSSIAPLIGGLLADYFASIQLTVSVQWNSPRIDKIFKLLFLHEWNFLFVISALLALVSLEFLIHINETGEMDKEVVKRIMKTSVRNNLKEYFLIGDLITWHEQLTGMLRAGRQRRQNGKTSLNSGDSPTNS